MNREQERQEFIKCLDIATTAITGVKPDEITAVQVVNFAYHLYSSIDELDPGSGNERQNYESWVERINKEFEENNRDE